jgi:DNA-binding transcriptional MerR regulator
VDYTIEQLEDLTGFARRTIRYYIQQGLVEAPFGARKTPRYTEQHVEQLLLVRKYKDAGLNLGRIAELLKKGESQIANAPSAAATFVSDISLVSRLHISAGVTLDIDRAQCNLTEEQLKELANTINATVNKQATPSCPQEETND